MSDNEKKFVPSDEKKDYVNFLEKKNNLKIVNPNFSINLKFSSYKKILNQIETPLELFVNYITFRTISQNIKYETQTITDYNVSDEYKKLLEVTKYFYVIKPEYSNLEDEEKMEHQIILRNNSLRKIMKLIGEDFIQSLSFIEIIITTITYEYLIHRKKKEKNLNDNIKRLLDYYLIYNIGDNIIISDYSIKKILSLAKLDLYDLPDYLKIKKFNGDEELRKKKINNLIKITKNLSNIQEIKKNKKNTLKNFTIGYDISEKNKEINIDDIEFAFNEASNLMDDIINKLNNKKKEINNNCDNENNLFIYIKDKDGNDVCIRKSYVKLIENYPNDKINNFNVLDINNKNVLIPKNNLKNILNENNYVLIKNNNNESLLVKKDDLKKLYNEWKNLKEKKEINSKNPEKLKKIELLNNDIIIQKEINNLPNQSEEEELNKLENEKEETEKILNEKKNNLIKEIENPINNKLIEIQPNKLINSSLYNQIINNNEENDNYTIPEYLTKKKISVSKKNLNSINLKEDNQCILLEEASKNKKIILRINYIKEKLNKPNLEKKQILKCYEGNEEEVDLLDLNISKLEDEKLENNNNNPANDNLKKMLENPLILIKIGENLIPKNIIDTINEDKSNKNEFEVVSFQSELEPKNKYVKITKSEAKKINDYPHFVEINIEEPEIEENKKTRFVKKNDVEKSINDNNEEINLNDFKNVNFKAKKNKVLISQYNTNYNLGKQSKDYINDIKKNIDFNKTLIDVFDENGKNSLVRKEYINLIKNDNNIIDRYEIPNVKGENIFVSKKNLNNTINYNEYIPIINIENNKLHYINIQNINDLNNKFIDENYEFNEFNNNNKLPIKVKNIIISQDKNNIIKLPLQKEEIFMKDLIKKRQIINQNNNDSDIILMNDNNNQPMYVFYKNINDINNDIQKFDLDKNLNQKYNKRENYKIIDVKGVEHKININNLNKAKNSPKYCIIIVNKQRKLVDKNNLNNELNKADNSKYKMQNLKNAINNNENIIISPQDFQFDIIQAFNLPEQDKLTEKTIPSLNIGNNNEINSNIYSNLDSKKDFPLDLNKGNQNKIEMKMDEITNEKKPISFKSKPKKIEQIKLPPKNYYNIRRAIIRKRQSDDE